MPSKASTVELTKTLWEQFQTEREHLDLVDKWARGKQPEPWKPRSANSEYKALQDRSYTPLLNLVVSSLSQACYVDGFRSPLEVDDNPAWKIWQANGFDSRQVAVHRGTFSLGQSFIKVLPGIMPDRTPMPVVRGISARKMYPVYQNPAEDEWPEYALQVEASGKGWMLSLIDDEVTHRLGIDPESQTLEYIDFVPHGMGVCPVVRVPNLLDLDGRVMGEVEPFIPVAARIDQVTFDRLMVQRFASWKVRYVAGMAKPETVEEEAAKKLSLRQDDILIAANKDTKFGTLDESPLDGFTAARDSDLMLLSVVSQLPPQYFGQIANLSADALAMAEASLMRKVAERQATIGEAHEQWMRLAASSVGIDVPVDAQVKWRDVESRSLAQVADALGKIATQLNFPAQILWEKIPGLTQTDIEEAKRLIEQGDSLQQLFDSLDKQAAPDAGVA